MLTVGRQSGTTGETVDMHIVSSLFFSAVRTADGSGLEDPEIGGF